MNRRALSAILLVIVAVFACIMVAAVLEVPSGFDTRFHTTPDKWAAGCAGNLKSTASTAHFLDNDDYVASWSPNLIGERVTIHPGVSHTWTGQVDQAKVRLFLDMDGNWNTNSPTDRFTVLETLVQLPTNYGTGTDIICLTSHYWDIKHPDGKTVIPHGAMLRADLVFHFWLGTWVQAGWQDAFLNTGIGEINRNQDQVKVGDTASWTWHVGYISDDNTGKGWTAYVTSAAQGERTVLGPTTLKTWDGTLSYKVVAADFSTSSTRNELTAHLRNELWSKSFDITTTITEEQLAHAPTCEIEGVSPQSPKQGESVTVDFSCSPASSADEDAIDRITITWGYGSDDYRATLEPDATSYTFTAGQSGYARLMVIAYTKNNVPSATRSVDIQVEHQQSNIIGGFGAGGLPWMLLLGIVFLIVGFILWKVGANLPLRIAGLLLGVGGLALFAFGLIDLVRSLIGW